MKPSSKFISVVVGYAIALVTAAVVVSIYVAATDGADRQSSGGMYAFGDSTNDLLMLQFAGNSIAMGDSDPLILPHCTYQTTNIEDNGIANALKHFHLI